MAYAPVASVSARLIECGKYDDNVVAMSGGQTVRHSPLHSTGSLRNFGLRGEGGYWCAPGLMPSSTALEIGEVRILQASLRLPEGGRQHMTSVRGGDCAVSRMSTPSPAVPPRLRM